MLDFRPWVLRLQAGVETGAYWLLYSRYVPGKPNFRCKSVGTSAERHFVPAVF